MKRGIVAASILLCAAAFAAQPIVLPGGEGGIGFDDMRWAPALRQVLVPAGRTGRLALIDPRSGRVQCIAGFTASAGSGEGHGAGSTSADAGAGLLFASDRNRRVVDIIDLGKKRIVADVALGGGPDYVRWVEPLGEVWVTEPSRKQIERFALSHDGAPRLFRRGAIAVPDGPESLAIDATRGRAYTHTWHDHTLAIDLKQQRVVAQWENGCAGARGIALDEGRGWLFVGCEEGKAVSLDVAHGGKELGRVATGKGVDIIAWSPRRSHLYVPGGDAATLSIVAVDAHGGLRVVRTLPTAPDAHCVAADDLGHAYVCDPTHGRVLVFDDPAPSTP